MTQKGSDLEASAIRETRREPAASFYARLSANYGTELDLDAIIRDGKHSDKDPQIEN